MKDLSLYNIKIEQALLSIMLTEPSLLPEIMERVSVDDFYDLKHKKIYATLIKLANKEIKTYIDSIVLIDELNKQSELNEVGSESYIEEILSQYTLSSSYNQYINIILDYSKKRKMKSISQYINDNLLNNESNELLDDIQIKISNIYNENNENSLIHISDLILRHKEQIEKMKNEGNSNKILTGFYRYDELTNGLKEGNMLILAARPSVGKTALCLNIALEVAKKNKNVLIFSLEMGEEELLQRLISMESEIRLKDIVNFQFVNSNEAEISRFSKSLNTLNQLNLFIDATATPTISKIKNSCRNMQRSNKKIDFIVIDYLQLISGGSKSSGNREQEIAEISRGLKLLAKELKVPILALSQLSRKVDSRENKRPLLSDLRESGSIEQDADQVMFLYNPNYHNPNKEEVKGEETVRKAEFIELILAKHRSGKVGRIVLLFDKEMQKFRNPSKEEEINYFSSQSEN